jgi:hypothetical protein
MRKILFPAIILALFTYPVWAQKFAPTNKNYSCLINEYSNAVEKADLNDSFLNRKDKYFVYETVDVLSEEFSFLIQDFKMDHQTEVNNLNIKIRFRYENGIAESKYPDFRAILKDIEDFLNNYPNKVDYWEILNKNLTRIVLKKYPMLENITSEIQVSPSQKVPYLRSSIVTRKQPKRLKAK